MNKRGIFGMNNKVLLAILVVAVLLLGSNFGFFTGSVFQPIASGRTVTLVSDTPQSAFYRVDYQLRAEDDTSCSEPKEVTFSFADDGSGKTNFAREVEGLQLNEPFLSRRVEITGIDAIRGSCSDRIKAVEGTTKNMITDCVARSHNEGIYLACNVKGQIIAVDGSNLHINSISGLSVTVEIPKENQQQTDPVEEVVTTTESTSTVNSGTTSTSTTTHAPQKSFIDKFNDFFQNLFDSIFGWL